MKIYFIFSLVQLWFILQWETLYLYIPFDIYALSFEKRSLEEGWLDQKENILYLLVRRFEWETPEYSSEKEMEGERE